MNSELGNKLGDNVQTESALGSVNNKVLGQLFGQDGARERASFLDTRRMQVLEVRHQESGFECEPRRLDDETVAKTQN